MERRAFLQVTGSVGAGLVIGFRIPGRRGVASPPFAPNAWLQIDPTGAVTVTLDKSEMGEGNHTALAMLVAEELDADWTKVKVGPLPENPKAWSRRMSTGGSTSVRTSWDILRAAGASARAMLVGAAAQTWSVDPGACRTESGVVMHAQHRATYGELAAKAATIAVPANPPLKDPKDFRLLGKRTHRLDTPSKVNGTAQFGIDVRLPSMLIASVERSPVFGGKVKSFDATRAKTLPGVRNVVQLEGTPWTGVGGAWGVGTASGVAVVADTYWQAVQGRQALQITWDEGANATLGDIPARLAVLAAQGGVQARKDGDATAALAGAAKKIEAFYEVPFLHHATMEPMNCTAFVRADSCEVWAPTQNQTRAQQVAAEAAGLPVDKVRIHTTLLGGGFGRRLESDFVAEAVSISKAVNAPVKVIWSREDDTKHGFYRPATYNALTAGLDTQNKPVAWTHHIVAPPILLKFGPLQNGVDRTLIDGAANVPYAFPNVFVDQVAADLPVPLGFWRSVGASQNAFVVESFMDELAVAAGRDPYEFRRELLQAKPRHLRTLDLAATKAGWGTPLPPGAGGAGGGRGRGIAIAEWEPTTCAAVAEVSVASDGTVRVHRVVCAVDCGPVVNPDTIEAQMQGGVVFGLSAALYGEITIENGRVKQSNFNDYQVLRIPEMPVVEVHIVPSSDALGGIGEPSVPPTAPAVCNAIFAATGKRIRRLPIGKVT
ncbi:MAG TPA: xanthine dehydrogenase family protein molybdopterin-binding subunit [Gemmatimonadales bacterium]|nr:xanthine dehydrogenase family protein molybdopterin-binding subunit [Gemmatimonadales bacterium]